MVERIIDESQIVVLWNSRTSDHFDNQLPAYISTMTKNSSIIRIVIVITPLKHGLIKTSLFFHSDSEPVFSILPFINFLVNEIKAPLFNNAIVSSHWLPLMLKFSCLSFQRSLHNQAPDMDMSFMEKMSTQLTARLR